MAGKCKLDLSKRERALLRKAAAAGIPAKAPGTVAFDNLWLRGLLRYRSTGKDYTLSQKGQRWLAALEREEG